MKRIDFLLFLCVESVIWAQPRYTIVNLQAMGIPASQGTFGRSINNAGDVVGSYWTPGQTELRVFKYTDEAGIIDLGRASGGTHTYPTGINDSGQIAAFGAATPGGPYLGYRYTSGSGFERLGSLGERETETGSINNLGQVTGFSELEDHTEHAFRYTDGLGMEDLGSLYGGQSAGRGINDLGWVTGASDGEAFLYRDGIGMVSLGPGWGWAINDQSAVVGESLLAPGSGQAFIYLNGEMRLLGSLGGESEARGINNQNEVVGWSYVGQQMHAFLWTEDHGMLDLNSLVETNSGWTLWTAMDINDMGQIVGTGLYDGKDVAFRLDLIPEPSTWGLLGLSAAIWGLWRKWRGKAGPRC